MSHVCDTGMDYEGTIFALIKDKKSLELLKEKSGYATVYKAYFFGSECDGDKIATTKLPKDCKVWSGTMDQHMCYNFADLEETYENFNDY